MTLLLVIRPFEIVQDARSFGQRYYMYTVAQKTEHATCHWKTSYIITPFSGFLYSVTSADCMTS